MNKHLTYLFVYGSLRAGFHHLAHAYISDYFVLTRAAKVRGKLYNLDLYPAAVKTSEENFVKGELYQLRAEENFSEAFAKLDEYEEVNFQNGKNPLFIREIAEVFFEEKSIMSWVYWYNRKVSGNQQVLSGDILDLKKAAKFI